MPTPGLSLLGFMDQTQALQHLRGHCVPSDASDDALLAEWERAKTSRGAPAERPGVPDIQPMPAEGVGHVQQLLAREWFQPALPTFAGASFQMVEIEPLLAYQLTVDTARAAHHCGALSNPPTLQELLAICLPVQPPEEQIEIHTGPQSAIVRSRSLNVRTLMQGIFNAQFMGVHFGPALPLEHVVRHNGRCYLHNGFHRAYGAKIAGATHIPCVVRDVADHAAVGIKGDGSTFSAELLESADPPTVGHFTRGRAHPVALRVFSRLLHVSWAEYALPAE